VLRAALSAFTPAVFRHYEDCLLMALLPLIDEHGAATFYAAPRARY